MRVLKILPPVFMFLATISAPSVAPEAGAQTLAPTPLEAFAGRPGARIVWSSPIGDLESRESRAVFTAIAVEHEASTPRTMRGLRIDLMHLQTPDSCNLLFLSHAILCARPNAAISFEEEALPRVREGVRRGNAEDSLIISFRRGGWNAANGVIIGGYTFDHRQPEELVALIERAITELQNAPM